MPQLSHKLLYIAIGLAFFGIVCYAAVDIRLNAGAHCPVRTVSRDLVLTRPPAVRNYGRVIHEFDPWFHFRATKYLVENGWHKFITWFDYESWYPIGRPIGKSIYPGMQVAAAVIHWFLGAIGQPLSLNDVYAAPCSLSSLPALNPPPPPHSCVFVPAYFSVLTCLFLFGMANEIRGPKAGLAAAAIMSAQPVTSRTRPVILTSVFRSVLPAHLMRSVAGGYDNESVAGTCAPPLHPLLRTPSSWLTPFPLSQLPPCPARSGCGCCPCAAASGSCSASHAPSCTSS